MVWTLTTILARQSWAGTATAETSLSWVSLPAVWRVLSQGYLPLARMGHPRMSASSKTLGRGTRGAKQPVGCAVGWLCTQSRSITASRSVERSEIAGFTTGCESAPRSPGLLRTAASRVESVLGFLVAFSIVLHAQAPVIAEERLRSRQFMLVGARGLSELFNLDFDAAASTFGKLADAYPEHPAPPLYQATAAWLRILDDCREPLVDRFVHPGSFLKTPSTCPADSTARQRLRSLLAAGQQLAERRLKTHPQDPDARYYRGVGEGLSAAIAITLDHSSLEAFLHVKRACALHSDLYTQDPNYTGAAMLPGLCDYVSASLPWYLRLMLGGDKRRGLESVGLAVANGDWVSNDGRFIRAVLLVRENRLAEALADLSWLFEKYPHNYQLHLARAQILDRLGRHPEADTDYAWILRLAEEGKPNYRRLDISALRWTVGNRMLRSAPQSALGLYQSVLADSANPERWRVLATLQSGCALDLLGRREDAISKYRTVLGMQEYEGSRAHATGYIRSPFIVSANSVALPRLFK